MQEYPNIDVAFVKGVLKELDDLFPGRVFPAVNVRSPTMKWRLASAMQKAYRRKFQWQDQSMFFNYLAGLHQIDPNYAWRRFPVVVIEDAGVPMVREKKEAAFAALLYCARGKTVRAEVGATEHHLCKFAWLFYTMHRCRLVSDAVSALKRSDHGLILKPILDAGEAIGTTIKTYTTLLEKGPDRLRHLLTYAGYSKNPVGATKALLDDADALFDPLHAWIAVEGVAQRQGGMFSLFPRIIQDSEEDIVRDDDMSPVEMIGAYPSCAFDMHVGEGKKAIGYFLAMKNVETVKLLTEYAHGDKEKMGKMIKEPLFFVELSCLKDRLRGSHSVQDVARVYEIRSLHACGKENGLNTEQCNNLVHNLAIDIPSLNFARKKVITP